MKDAVDALADFLEQEEGFSPTPYQDQAGVWTNGFGNTDGVTADTPPVTRDEAVAKLAENMQKFIQQVDDFVEVPLNVNQKAALYSLVYNAGMAPLHGHLGEYVNEGAFIAAAQEFPKWDHYSDKDSGQLVESDGLKNRRLAEMALFEEPVEEEVASN
jgi:lysozyme